MAELADALALGASGRKAVQVRPLFPAPPRRCECNGDVTTVRSGLLLHTTALSARKSLLSPGRSESSEYRDSNDPDERAYNHRVGLHEKDIRHERDAEKC